MDCIFCRIVEKKMPADIVYEDEETMVFHTIRPTAPVHLLVIPKKHIVSADHVQEEEKDLIGQLFLSAQKAAKKMNLEGYKLAVNVGEKGGQEIFHLHVHLLGGWKNAKDRDIPSMP